ncbi:unnamed protein product [Blepharisma stoltei]|uniref:Uncharacterized protein n=1 Tax=Blepharisma stoltei TaxID=1481888 RepID=A0AAU9I9S7_9CILI|nr:unnamed protein product [Blepharisma stoltei]
MSCQQFSNINEILARMTGELIEECIYDQNESIDVPSSYSAHTSSLGFSSSSIGFMREADPSQMNVDSETLPNYKKKDVGILSLFRTPTKPSKRQASQGIKRGNNSFKHPKKEYIRCKLIRGHKRANRQIQENVLPNKTIHRFNPNDTESASIWETLKEVYARNQEVLRDLSLTENGPQTDGKSKRLPSNDPKSFNTTFCANYFKEQATRESFFYYTELLFCNFEPKILIEKFEIWCCPEGSKHDFMCDRKWSLLKRYINDLMIEDLKADPWFPTNYNREKITDEELTEILKMDKNRDGDRYISDQPMIIDPPIIMDKADYDYQLNDMNEEDCDFFLQL